MMPSACNIFSEVKRFLIPLYKGPEAPLGSILTWTSHCGHKSLMSGYSCHRDGFTGGSNSGKLATFPHHVVPTSSPVGIYMA